MGHGRVQEIEWFQVGEMFPSYDILKYEEANTCKFYVRDSRTIIAAKGRVKRTLSDDLKFYELTCFVFMEERTSRHVGMVKELPCMLIVQVGVEGGF